MIDDDADDAAADDDDDDDDLVLILYVLRMHETCINNNGMLESPGNDTTGVQLVVRVCFGPIQTNSLIIST